MDLYVQGRDRKLDKKYSEYKKLCLWSGTGLSCALREEDMNSLVDLWKKDLRTPWKLTVHDVCTLVDLSERISLFRMNMKREKARLRKERSRAKMRNAAKEGNPKACIKCKQIKKAERKESQNIISSSESPNERNRQEEKVLGPNERRRERSDSISVWKVVPYQCDY